MIELVPERLPEGQEERLRKWLASPDAEIFRRVLVSKSQLHQADALRRALEAEGQPDASSAWVAQDDLRQAIYCEQALKIFNGFAAQAKNDHFQTAKLKPHHQNASHTSTPEST